MPVGGPLLQKKTVKSTRTREIRTHDLYRDIHHISIVMFQVEIFSGETLLDTPVGTRPAENSLAKIGVELVSVDGYLRVSSAIKAEASLENFVLDDCRSVEL